MASSRELCTECNHCRVGAQWHPMDGGPAKCASICRPTWARCTTCGVATLPAGDASCGRHGGRYPDCAVSVNHGRYAAFILTKVSWHRDLTDGAAVHVPDSRSGGSWTPW